MHDAGTSRWHDALDGERAARRLRRVPLRGVGEGQGVDSMGRTVIQCEHGTDRRRRDRSQIGASHDSRQEHVRLRGQAPCP